MASIEQAQAEQVAVRSLAQETFGGAVQSVGVVKLTGGWGLKVSIASDRNANGFPARFHGVPVIIDRVAPVGFL